ncbi:membrane protein insertion efficiency factor YidD [Alphaproteobacteria bacterium]|nr:membrane protein insertion efficiency factor YidD [Alphaproteobacteria bacterium]
MFEQVMIKNICIKCVINLINIYKYLISPLLGNNCRFLPTCSEYTKESIIKFGLVNGVWLGLKRIVRCHPWGKSGHDPIK